MAIVSSIISILSFSKKGEQDEQAVKPPTMGKNTCEAIQLMELKRSVQHKISTSWERASCIKELTQSRRSIPESVISQLLDSIAESQAAFREFSHIADAIAKRHADIDNLEPREETSSEYESCSQSPATEIPASAISCDTAITLLPDRLGEEILHDIQESYPEEYTSTFPAQALANVATTAQVDDAKTGRSTLHRRSALPAPPESMESVNLVSIVRSNFGKDLSTVAMPIGLNEPLNLLQKLAEELEYCELLDLASKSENVVDRMVYISAFAVSGYASVATRAGRKP
ncbi:Oxysterol-binding protein- protein 3, partial [Entophlyctis luteolus]